MGTIQPSLGTVSILQGGNTALVSSDGALATTLSQGGNTATVDDWSSDGLAASLDSVLVRAGSYGWNGATWDRSRSRIIIAALPSTGRTVTTASADYSTYNAVAALATLDITNVSGAGASLIYLQLQIKDSISGSYTNLITQNGFNTVSNHAALIAPGATADPDNGYESGVGPGPIGDVVRVNVFHDGSGTFTYSVSLELI